MAILVNGLDGNPWTPRDMDASGSNLVKVLATLGFTGNYTTGVNGDILDLSSVAAQVPSGSLPISITESLNGPVGSFSKGGGYIQVEKGSALNNNKVKFFTAGGAEQGSGTYASFGATTDLITLEIVFRKLL